MPGIKCCICGKELNVRVLVKGDYLCGKLECGRDYEMRKMRGQRTQDKGLVC